MWTKLQLSLLSVSSPLLLLLVLVPSSKFLQHQQLSPAGSSRCLCQFLDEFIHFLLSSFKLLPEVHHKLAENFLLVSLLSEVEPDDQPEWSLGGLFSDPLGSPGPGCFAVAHAHCSFTAS